MARTVHCIKLGTEAEGLDFPPYPGELGKRIWEGVSKEAWAAWLKHQPCWSMKPPEPRGCACTPVSGASNGKPLLWGWPTQRRDTCPQPPDPAHPASRTPGRRHPPRWVACVDHSGRRFFPGGAVSGAVSGVAVTRSPRANTALCGADSGGCPAAFDGARFGRRGMGLCTVRTRSQLWLSPTAAGRRTRLPHPVPGQGRPHSASAKTTGRYRLPRRKL